MNQFLTPHIPKLNEYLKKDNYLKTYPLFEERAKWENVIEADKALFISEGERFLNFSYPALKASYFLEFERSGNRTLYEKLYFERRKAVGSLAMAEAIEGKGRFFDDLLNGIWGLCEESTWVLHAHYVKACSCPVPQPHKKQIDLFAADTASLLAFIYHIYKNHFDKITPEINKRILSELSEKIKDPFIEKEDFNWLGFQGQTLNNWTPWILSNIIAVFLYAEPNIQSTKLAIEKSMRSIDCFLGQQHDDGGCDEGPIYWFKAAGSLFNYLDLLFVATNGKINIYEHPTIKNLFRFILQTHIHGDFFVNFADSTGKFHGHNSLIVRLGLKTGDIDLKNFGASRLHYKSEIDYIPWYEMNQALEYLFLKLAALPIDAITRERSINYNDTQIFIRNISLKNNESLFFAAKGGHNAESHNHNDVGNFIF